MSSKVAIVFCTSGGYFGSLVLRQLLDSPHCRVVGVVQSSRILRTGYGWLQGAMEQIRISGPRYAWYLWCATTLADILGAVGKSRSVASLVAQYDLPLLKTNDVNDDAGQDFLHSLQPDLLICGFFNQRLAEHCFTFPGLGSLNIHPSLLPQDRGVDPVFFARLRQSSRFGVTLHRVACALDAGAILAQRRITDDPSDSVFRLTARLYRLGAELLLSHFDAVRNGEAGQEQGGGGNYDSWPSAIQVASFHRQGAALLRVRDLWDLWRGRLLRENRL
jgi:folate-dependent phosphoribosylglycinamide formyltransferase PurN